MHSWDVCETMRLPCISAAFEVGVGGVGWILTSCSHAQEEYMAHTRRDVAKAEQPAALLKAKTVGILGH